MTEPYAVRNANRLVLAERDGFAERLRDALVRLLESETEWIVDTDERRMFNSSSVMTLDSTIDEHDTSDWAVEHVVREWFETVKRRGYDRTDGNRLVIVSSINVNQRTGCKETRTGPAGETRSEWRVRIAQEKTERAQQVADRRQLDALYGERADEHDYHRMQWSARRTHSEWMGYHATAKLAFVQ